MRNQETKLSPNEETIFYLRNHPTIAARILLNIRLNWIQRLALKAIWTKQSTMEILGRRVGKTFSGSIACVLRGMLYANEKIIIVAPGKRQVDNIFLNEITPLFHSSDYFKASVVGKVSITNAYNRIKFTNGSTIEGFPVGTEGNKVRGFGANFMWIDEYASMSESVVNLVFRPMLAVSKKGQRNRLLITCSAFYRWNHMWPLFQYYTIKSKLEPDRYAVFNYNYEHLLLSKNLPVEFDMDIINEAKETMTETEFQMEYKSIFPIDIEGFFTSKLIEDCTPKPPDEKPIEIELKGTDGTYYMGVDAARAEGGANFSISIVKKYRKEGRVVNVHTMNGATFQDMTTMIRRYFIDFNVSKIKIDAGGGGMTLKDLLREPWDDYVTHQRIKPLVDKEDTLEGLRVIEMVNITSEKHNNLYMNFKSELEHGRVKFPINLRRDSDAELERIGQELIALKTEMQVVTAKPRGKYLYFEAPNKKFRTDRIMSTMLAIDCYIEDSKLQEDEDCLAVGSWISFN